MVGAPAQPAIAPRGRPKALRNAEVSWLMRTTYIQQDSNTVRRRGTDVVPVRAADDDGGDIGGGRDAQLAAIEATFAAAAAPPVHPKDPSVVPVEILPVLPDFECWANKYVQAHFDSDPTEEVESLARLPLPIRRAVAERSMLKGFRMDQAQGAEDAVRGLRGAG
eukprot:355668-Chlamydomonas_euryale.AAC.9